MVNNNDGRIAPHWKAYDSGDPLTSKYFYFNNYLYTNNMALILKEVSVVDRVQGILSCSLSFCDYKVVAKSALSQSNFESSSIIIGNT
jgi:hypothetical protein